MPENKIRKHIAKAILKRLDQNEEKRREALEDFFAVTMTAPDEKTAQGLADMVPCLLPDLYKKWIDMFVDRLLETVPMNQIELICEPGDENEAAIVLAYIMFLESERMEKQIDRDLKEYASSQSGQDELGDMAANYIRAKMGTLAREMNDKKGGNGS